MAPAQGPAWAGCLDLLLDRHVRAGHGAAPALVEHGAYGRRGLSYGQVQGLSVAIAHDLALSLAGSRTPRRIALVGAATLETICYWLAAMRAGHLPLLVDPAQPADQLGRLWTAFDPELVLHDGRAGSPPGSAFRPVEAWLAGLAAAPPGPPTCAPVGRFAGAFDARPALVQASGAGAARPSLCVHAHRAFWDFERNVSRPLWQIRRDDRLLGTAGPCRAAGLRAVHVALAAGACAVLLPAWRETGEVLEAIAREAVSVLLATPAQLHLMLAGAHRRHDLSTLGLTLCGGERLPDLTRRNWQQLSGARVLDAIDSAETFGPYLSETRQGGPGMVRVPGYIHEQRRLAAAAGDGACTLWLSQGNMMLGYMIDGDSVRLDPPDVPFATGDVFAPAGAGLRFLSRENEGWTGDGHWLCPQALEECLLADPGVGSAAAFVPAAGRRLHALVVPLPGWSGNKAELAAALMGRAALAPQALHPERIEIVPALPLRPDGAVRRQDLWTCRAAPD